MSSDDKKKPDILAKMNMIFECTYDAEHNFCVFPTAQGKMPDEMLLFALERIGETLSNMYIAMRTHVEECKKAEKEQKLKEDAATAADAAALAADPIGYAKRKTAECNPLGVPHVDPKFDQMAECGSVAGSGLVAPWSAAPPTTPKEQVKHPFAEGEVPPAPEKKKQNLDDTD